MAHDGDCFLVPGPVRMSQACLDALASPTITARGTEFRDVMARLNSGLRYAFNLSHHLMKGKISHGLAVMVTE